MDLSNLKRRDAMRLAVAAAGAAAWPFAANAQKVLTLAQAVEAASKNQPQLRQARAVTEAARARADVARAPLLPQVNLNLGYSHRTNHFANTPGSVPSGTAGTGTAASFDSVNYLSSGLTASQLVWDFGQTLDRYRAQRLSANTPEDSEVATVIRPPVRKLMVRG